MRMWTRVLAQGHEVIAVMQRGIADPDKVDWTRVARRGSGRGSNPAVGVQVGMQFVDMLGIHICAGDKEGMGGSDGSDDEPVAPPSECGSGGQDVGGSNDSATLGVLLPDMSDSCGEDSNSNNSEEEDRVLFEKR